MATKSLSRARGVLGRVADWAKGFVEHDKVASQPIRKAAFSAVETLERRTLFHFGSIRLYADLNFDEYYTPGVDIGFEGISVTPNIAEDGNQYDGSPATTDEHGLVYFDLPATTVEAYGRFIIPPELIGSGPPEFIGYVYQNYTWWSYDPYTTEVYWGMLDTPVEIGFQYSFHPTENTLTNASEDDCICPTPSSTQPVRYADGQMTERATDLLSEGFGMPWPQSRSWSNLAVYHADDLNGNGWASSDMPRLRESFYGYGADIGVQFDSTRIQWFSGSTGDVFSAQHDRKDTFTYGIADDASGDNEYVLTTEDGNQ